MYLYLLPHQVMTMTLKLGIEEEVQVLSPPPPSTWPRTKTGASVHLSRCITLTDRLIVDKQPDSMPAPPRPSPPCRLTVRRRRRDLLALPRMTTMLHPSLSLRHKRVLCGAGCCCLLVSLCHHYRVTDRKTRAGHGGSEGGGLRNRRSGRELPRSTGMTSCVHLSSYS